MRDSSRDDRDATWAEVRLVAFHDQQDLTLEHVEGLVSIRMLVQRGCFATLEVIFEQ